MGADYEGYRGHIYRVLTYTLHYLGEPRLGRHNEYADKFRPMIEVRGEELMRRMAAFVRMGNTLLIVSV